MPLPHRLLPLLTALALTSSVFAQDVSCRAGGTMYRFKFGDFNATVFRDGTFRFTSNPLLVPEAFVVRAFRFFYPGGEGLTASLNTLLLERGDLRMLVDAGLGARSGFGFQGRTRQLLIDAGVAPSSINAVLITHAHGDHVAGLALADGSAAFPNASVYVHREEFNFWTRDPVELAQRAPDLPLASINQTVLGLRRALQPYQGKVVIFDDNQTLFNGVQAIPTRGHTPGHTSFRVTSQGRSLFITGDTTLSRTTTTQNPNWNIFSDTNRTQAVLTRLKMFDSLVADKSLVLAFHELYPGLGYVIPQGPFFDWTPVVAIPE